MGFVGRGVGWGVCEERGGDLDRCRLCGLSGRGRVVPGMWVCMVIKAGFHLFQKLTRAVE